jgi:sec-independent protein translocase protein TatC
MTASEPQADSLISHLMELRARLLRAAIALLLVFVALLPFAQRLYDWLAAPILHHLPVGHLIATGIASPFFAPVTLAFFAALGLAMPYVLYQAWAFVAPGLYRHERRLARPVLVAAVALFYAGAAFAYWLVLPTVFAFLERVTPDHVQRLPDITEYLNFVLVVLFAFGASFEVPVAVVVLVLLRIVTPAQLAEARGYVIVGIFIVAAVLTPPDAVSQLMLAVPMIGLYEIGLLWARLLVRRRKAAA